MDVEDEEKFLYGDSDARETYPPSKPQDRGYDSQWNYKNPDRGLVSKVNDPYHQASEPRRDFHPQVPANAPVAPANQLDPLYGRSTFPVLERSQGHNMEPPYTAQKVPEEPPYKPAAPAPPQPPIHIEPPQADLLSIFTNKPTSAIPTSQPMEPVAQPVTTKTNYDPTIENILKSIGFDFEMSKRMQEKAKTVETKLKEEPELVGINQTASFLEGGLIDGNLKDSLFVKKGSEIDRKSGYDDLYSKDDPQAALLEEGIVFKRKRSSDGSKSEGSHHEQQKYPTSTAPVSSYPGYTGSYSQADQYPPSAYSYAHQGVPPGYTTASGVPYGYEASQHPGYAAPAKPRYADTGHSPIPSLASSNLKSVPIQDKNSSDAKKHRRTEKESSLDRERERAPSSSSLKELKNVDSPRSKSESTKSLPLENIRVISAVDSGSQRLVLPPKSEQSKYVLKQSDDWDTPKSKKIGSSPKVGEKRTLSESSDHSQKSQELSSKQIEKLRKEKEIRQQRILALEEELQKLRKQQNEIMRKKRRQKDGHKDPILMQNSKLQEEIAQQISKLRKASEQNEKRMSTPDKKDGPPESKKLKEQKKDEPTQKPPPKSEEITEPQEKKVTAKDVRDKLEAASNTEQKPKQFSFQVKGELKVRYEYFDQGIHWCKSCNIVYSSLQIYMQHLHTANHLKSLCQYDKPWTPEEMKNPPKKPAAKKTSVLPVKGSEFLIPTSGFWCSLCKVLVGDIACGEFHMKSDAHHENYLAYTKDNPFYEQRRNLDKATALSSKREENLKNREIERKFELNPEQKQKDKRIKEKQKNFEKEVKELDDDEPQRHSTSSKKMLPISKLSKPGKDVPDPKTEKDGADVKKAVEEAKKAIEVKIFKKAGGQGNPTLQQGKAIPTITQRKRNTVLPPWTPVSKSGTAPGEKKLVTAEDILKAFSGKSKEKEKEEEEAKKKKEEEQRLVEETKKIEEMTKKQENMQQAKSNVVSADIPLPKGSYGHRAKDDWESPKKAVKLGPKPLMDLNIPPPLPFGQPGMNIRPVPPQIPFPQQNVRPNINIRPPNIGPYSGQTRGIPNVNVRPPNVGPTSANNAQTKASSNTGSASITQTKTSTGNNTKNMATTPQTQKKGPPKAAPEIQSPDRVHEDEDVQFVSAHNKKVGDLVEIKDDSSSNDSVIVPIETMDALKPIKQNSVSEVELVAVAPDVESDEESVASSISMHMGSDYEVIDDIEQS
ncbi:hypothetical protein FSP39_011209 [Pinctada imbricata]|uniref:U1-type domain-containing protein n=1 Tax=Pinctada imbricata TaxID=66713 RepID=A0AA89BW86_PINIB|nr:hypothetical protein FSP39_011209 [Pinctada imbricata]